MHRDAPCYRLGSVCISQIIIADSRLSHSSVHRHQTLTDRFFFSNGTYAQPRIDGRAFYRCLASYRVVTCGTPQRSEVLPAGRRAQQVKVPSVPAHYHDDETHIRQLLEKYDLVPSRGISLAAATVRGLILTVSHKEQIGGLYPQVLETLVYGACRELFK